MNLTASEKATLNFYEWEYCGRGYYHFDDLVHIEPPYTPFSFKTYNDDYIDDGKVPSLFSRISTFLETPKKQEKETEKTVLVPKPSKVTAKLKGFSISFSKGQDISSVISAEFLNMLSFTEQSISFEIIGTQDSICIQFVCGFNDTKRIRSHLEAYFPTIHIKDISVFDIGFDTEKEIAIADFGLEHEFMRPIETQSSFTLDPLTSIIATLNNLDDGDTALFQVIFQGVTAPWSRDILYSVSDGQGGSFFSDSPEMLACANEKTSSPLFSVIVRIATQGHDKEQSNYLATELARSITSVSDSSFNKLIPLSNEGYDYDNHVYNVYHRTSHRLGMILNSHELVLFVHYPHKTVVSEKLHPQFGKSKLLADACINQEYELGVNEHEGIQNLVTLNDTQRLQHCHIIGATGVGKSTLIAHMLLNDVKAGNGCVLFDPHGDISDDVLLRIPEHRKGDVIIIDPSDTEFPIGFNLLQASTDAERIVLSSDLVSAFKRHATAWGDNMTAVLSNAINTFLESSTGGTLIELKRFLIEERFRNTYLEQVEDQSILYYWKYEYPMVKKGIAPLLTRIDTFLRPKIIRYMFAQKDGIDFKEAIANKKIIIIKLSLGLIGEENSYLLGSLFLSKINQVVHGRQSLPKSERHPYYVYLDEFHNFLTLSIASMLSGVRKYGIGLTLAHQDLEQIESSKILSSVISNPHTRICFRLGDNDAKKLESGFSFFEQADLQSLHVGEVIMRVGSSTNDFNVRTYPLAEINEEQSKTTKEYIIQNTRTHYAKPKDEVQIILNNQLPHAKTITKESVKEKREVLPIVQKTIISEPQPMSKEEIRIPKPDNLELQKQAYLKQTTEKEVITKHRTLQNYVRELAQQREFKTSLEEITKSKGRVDVSLTKNDIRIALEISVTNSLDYEVQNIQKCIDDGYTHIAMLSENTTHLANIKKRAKEIISKKYLQRVTFMTPHELASYLDSFNIKKKTKVKRVRGYRVKSNHVNINESQVQEKNTTLRDIILTSMKKEKQKKK